MLHFELLDESLDLNKTQHYHLSIQVRLDGFLFSILDPERSKYIGIKSYTFDTAPDADIHYEKIRDVLQEDPFLRKPYKGVSCIHQESRSTLLPAALFERDRLRKYFEFNHVLNNLDEIRYNYIKQADAYLIFPMYSEISNLYLKYWLNTNLFHQATPLIDSLLSASNLPDKRVGIHFNENHFDMVYVGHGGLKYHNNFRCRSDEDLLYFVLFVYNKLGLDTETIPLLLSGGIDKFSPLPQTLKRFIKNIAFLPAPGGFQYPPSFSKLQDHTLHNLLRIYRCG